MRDAIGWSYDLLTVREQSLYRQLGVFASGFTLEAAEAVAEGDVLDGITSLVDYSLLTRHEVGESDRYSFLEAIREHASDLLREDPEESNTRGRHAEYFVSLAEYLEPDLMSAGETAAMDLLSQDHSNFSAAVGWSSDHDAAVAARLTLALWYYWGTRGHYKEARAWVERTLQQPEGRVPLVRGRLLAAGGMLAWVQGDLVTANDYLNEAAELFTRIGDRFGMALTWFGLGQTQLSEHRFENAIAALEHARGGFRALGRTPWMIVTMSVQGKLLVNTGEFDRANEILSEALELSERIGFDRGRAQSCETFAYLALYARKCRSSADALPTCASDLEDHPGKTRGC